MKYILPLFLLILACNEINYKVNSCIHQADSMEIFKIVNRNDDIFTLNSMRNESLKRIKINSQWIITDCPN